MRLDKREVQHFLTRLPFSTKRRINFYKDIANAYAVGIPPIRALEQMRLVSQPRRRLKWLVRILEHALRDAGNGASFAQAMRPWVPPEDAAMLAAGEEIGDIGNSLRELTALLESKMRVTGALKAELIPSGVMLLAVIGLLVFIMNLIGPQAKELVPEHIMRTLGVLPTYIAIGEFVITWGILIALLAVGVVAAVWITMPRWQPDGVRQRLDKRMPPWSLSARVQTVFFLISAGSMMQAGRTFRASVEQIQQFSHPWTKAYLRQMLARLRAGSTEVKAMQVGMLPEDVADRLNFYAILPDFTRVMQETARESMDVLLAKVKVIGTIIRTLMMLILAFFIVFTLLSVYDMSDGIEKGTKQMQMG